jgi:hypothetical protein
MEKAGELEGMSEAQKQLAVVQQLGITGGTSSTAEDAKKYLEQAKTMADPYYKSLVNVALDELERSVTSTSQDLTYKKAQIDEKIRQLNEDLTYNKSTLTLDEQAEMATQLAEYESSKENLDLQMQEAGLTFSSPRLKAEEKLKSARDLTAQSTARKYGTARREAELEVSRNAAQLERERQLAERTAQEATTAAARATEAKVGTSAVPTTVAGQQVSTLGGIETGAIEDARQKAILDLASTIEKSKGELPTY